MESPDDITSPKTQRRMWRRVWISLALLLVLTPVVIWMAVDQGGKAEWRRVQAELRASGVATTIAELDLPKRGDVPDEENFCTISILTPDEDGLQTHQQFEINEELHFFQDTGDVPKEETEYPRDIRLELGQATDLAAWRHYLDAAASATGMAHVQPSQKNSSSAEAIAAYVARHEEIWKKLEDARDRPHSRYLPFVTEQLSADATPWDVTMFPNASFLVPSSKALHLRTCAALEMGDWETALRSTEVQYRLLEGLLNEPTLIQFTIATALTAMTLSNAAHCLWQDEFCQDDERLQRLQRALQRIDLNNAIHDAIQIELTFQLEGIHWIQRYREHATDYLLVENDGWESIVAKALPPGWFAGNAAYVADLYDRTLLSAQRSEATLAALRMASVQLTAEVNGLSGGWNRYYRSPVAGLVSPYESLISKVHRTETIRRQALIVCALYRHQLGNDGRFPESLSELVPDFLDSIPADPVDGRPMRYRQTQDADGSPSYRLWSIGYDLTDDGGTLSWDSEDPLKTYLYGDDYLGDWPWPVEPLKIDEAAKATDDD